MSELALKLIREAKETKSKKLDLGKCGLTELPDELFELVWLEELYLCNSGWRPGENIFKAVRFVSQNNGVGNNIKYFSPKIKLLKQLKILIANGGIEKWDLKDLSPLKGLKNLQYLRIEKTKVDDLDPLKYCKKLELIYFWSTKVSDLSPLKDLKTLRNLAMGGTMVSDLSPLKGLENLQALYVNNSQVSDLGPLKDLGSLQRLEVRRTQIRDLYPLKKLIEKGVLVNPNYGEAGITVKDCLFLTNPPNDIVKQGNEAILNYWKQIETQGGTQTINEAKLIIVGEGNTGKTTLFNKLIDSSFDLNKIPTEETKGINIHEGLEIKEGFRANLWDFGGQELQYMTHQFFLTPNAVYVLMMAAREEAPNLAYWFKIISLLGKDKSGGKVSLIIVLNKKKGSTGIPQYQDLLKIYEDDFDYQFIEVDLAVNDKRWGNLRESIEQRLVNLPIVKNELPKKWNPIRETLRKAALKRPYIDATRLHDLCEPFQVTELESQFFMTEYLHQLGSLLHFQGEEDNLKDLIVLSPEWVVEGVYTVLKDERIRETLKGKFSKKDMTKILCANKYKIGEKEKKYTQIDSEKLIQLMSKNNFDICYKSESGKYVAAQLLPKNRPPNFRWNKSFTTALQFRYQYPIMPKGLMSRLIVRLSGYLEIIDSEEIVWKKGAILKMNFDGSVCRIFMREEDGETRTGLKQIVIEVLEDKPPFRNRKYALQRVRQEIESIHKRWFKNITSEQIIPCNCSDCKDSDTPYTFELTKLMKLKKGRAYCNNQEEFVPLQQLLEGVYEPTEIKSFAQEKRTGDFN